MTVTVEYSIGSSYETLALLSALTVPVRWPRSYPMDYVSPLNMDDLTRRRLGYLMQPWHWDIMHVNEFEQMMTFEGTVFVCTLKNDETFGLYTCTFVGPEKRPERFAHHYQDVLFELRGLTTYTPPE